MQVLVTRPEPEAAAWVRDLQARGVDAVALPLIDIGPAPDPQALRRTHENLLAQEAVMFVSVNAVRGFFASGDTPPWPPALSAWAPGAGTAAALQEAGVPPGRIAMPAADSAQWDSEHLWARVASQVKAGFRLLVVRGADRQGRAAGRDWLSAQVASAGGSVETVCAYSRLLPAWSEAEHALAARSEAESNAWLFSSSEGVRHLAELRPRADWRVARAIATHPRIAEAAANLGFARVRTTLPTLDAVVASIESSR